MLSALRASVLAVSILLAGLTAASAQPEGVTRVDGPIVHRNLALYFLHGASRAGPLPLTLQEALEKRQVRVVETSNVNELKIENVGEKDVFIQAGDIVKGGRQDRTLNVSLVLPPKSGQIPIASFCVEAGRWSARGREDSTSFAASSRAVPSREMKLAMKENIARPSGNAFSNRSSETSSRQSKVWDGVRTTQEKLSRNIGQGIEAEASATSLELSLDNAGLKKAIQGYTEVLAPHGEQQDDIIGVVVAINGGISSADIYPANGLFRKMWKKQLDAAIIEAIGEQDKPGGPAPSAGDVEAFLASADKGAVSEQKLIGDSRMVTHDGDNVLAVEARRGAVVMHRNYLAKTR